MKDGFVVGDVVFHPRHGRLIVTGVEIGGPIIRCLKGDGTSHHIIGDFLFWTAAEAFQYRIDRNGALNA